VVAMMRSRSHRSTRAPATRPSSNQDVYSASAPARPEPGPG
jgi:hypothetical protein